MCFKRSHEVLQPVASFLLSLFVCLEIFCVAPGKACAAHSFLYVLSLSARCATTAFLFTVPLVLLCFMLPWAKPVAGQALLLHVHIFQIFYHPLFLYSANLGIARLIPEVFMCFCCPLVF